MDEKEIELLFDKITQEIEKHIGHIDDTSGAELEKNGKDMFGNKFIGVFTSDNIPKIGLNQYCIINLDKSGEPGSHWVAMANDNSNHCYIFDSFGRQTNKILPDMKNINSNVKMTDDDPNQKSNEKNCGQKCLAWLCVFDEFGYKVASLI